MMEILHCTVNGRPVEVGYDLRESLLDTLRDRLGLTSVKRGCEVGECGACTVLVDGVAIDSCIYLTCWAEGKHILTVEGLQGENGELTEIQKAFIEEAAVQCGFCTPGLVMSSTAFIEKHKGQPVTREEIRRGHAGNLCRCTGYDAIIAAVESCLNDTPPQNTCACLRKPDGPCHHRQS